MKKMVACEGQLAKDKPARVAVATEPVKVGHPCGSTPADRERRRKFWNRWFQMRVEAKESVSDADRAKQPANQATRAMVAAINELPESVRAAQLFKIGRMLSKAPALLVFIGDLRPTATGTVQDEGALLYPTRGYLDAIAAVRAGKTDWEIGLAAGLHPVDLRNIMPWLPRWPT